MLTVEENELLTRVEGSAPMGQLIRRHWIPACLSEEIAQPDGTPVAVRLLGEDLVAWRNSDGRASLMHRYCAHRRASLALGRNEDNGLRCLYHGWKFDAEGTVVDMPSEPSGTACAGQAVKIPAYPTHEHAGVVWAYLGPRETMPEFDPPSWAPTAETKVSYVKIRIDCNWAQILEGAIDSSHSSSLHSSDIVPARVGEARATASQFLRPSTDKAPRIQTEVTNYGFKYAAIRRPTFSADVNDYFRTTIYVAPITVLIPPNNLYGLANVNVPIDDTHTMFYFIAWGEDEAAVPDQETWRQFLGAQVGRDLNEDFSNRRNASNMYQQDRTAMKLGNFTGIHGIPNQDIAMWETMGPITDRSLDRLAASDLAVVEFRRFVVDMVKKFRAGAPACGTREANGDAYIPQADIRSFEAVLPKNTNWRDLVATNGQRERIAALQAGNAKQAAAAGSARQPVVA
jgi:phthalate 4,5-dioxygenase oxygenase subunit